MNEKLDIFIIKTTSMNIIIRMSIIIITKNKQMDVSITEQYRNPLLSNAVHVQQNCIIGISETPNKVSEAHHKHTYSITCMQKIITLRYFSHL